MDCASKPVHTEIEKMGKDIIADSCARLPYELSISTLHEFELPDLEVGIDEAKIVRSEAGRLGW